MDILRSFANALTGVLDRFYISSVRRDPENIFYIQNPSKNVIIALAEIAPGYILYIQENHADKLTEDVKLGIVQNNPRTIEYFPDASEALQLAAVTKDPSTIVTISNPYISAQIAAMQQNSELIKKMDDPCEEARLMYIKENGQNISQIENPSEKEMLAAVNSNSSNIIYINNPSLKVQLAAVNGDANNILKIKNPSIEVCKAAIQKEFGNIKIPDQNVIGNTITLFSKRLEIFDRHDKMYQCARYADDFEISMREFDQADLWEKEQLSKAIQEFTEGGDSKLHINPDQCGKVTDNDIKDHEFRSAFEEGNNVKLSALKSEGYMPSHEVMQSLSHPFSDSTVVVVQKLFGIETPDHSGIQPVQSEIKADMKHHLSNAAELTL